jgi:hypothetical protein
LLPTANAEQVVLKIYESTGQALQDATIKVLRYKVSSNSFELVETARTNFNGIAVVDLILESEFYKFVVEYRGNVVYTSQSTYLYSNEVNLFVDLNNDARNDALERFDLTGSITFNNNTGIATFTYNDAGNTASRACLYVYRNFYNDREFTSQDCSVSPSGVIIESVPVVEGASYYLKGYIVKNGEIHVISEEWVDYDNPLPDDFNGLFYMFMIMLALGLVFIWDKAMMVLIVSIVPFIFSVIGLVPMGVGITAPIFLLGMVIAFIVRGKR